MNIDNVRLAACSTGGTCKARTLLSGARQCLRATVVRRPPPIQAAAATAAPAAANVQLRTLHDAPAKGALLSAHLDVGSGHSVYYEVHGNPSGLPAVVLHGGPGAGCYLNHTRFFDLTRYKVVLVDQRGCGRSFPRGRLVDNNTESLVHDLELLRTHLGISKWVLFGGSWGVTLAIAYALTHPERILGMVLRGVCLMRGREIQWMYGGGAGAIKPWAWQRFVGALAPEERSHPLLAYYSRLLSDDPAVRDAAARSWMEWEMAVGFDSRSQLLDWDGAQWSHQVFPSPPSARTPPRPLPLPLPLTLTPASPPTTSTPDPAAVPTNLTATPQQWRRHGRQLSRRGLGFAGNPGMATGTAQALLECHYSVHGAFMHRLALPGGDRAAGEGDAGVEAEGPGEEAGVSGGEGRRGRGRPRGQGQVQLVLHGEGADPEASPVLDRAGELRGIPAIAVHGQQDLVCPPTTAYELHLRWPELQLRLVPGAGHSMYDPAITHELVEATRIMYDVAKARMYDRSSSSSTAAGGFAAEARRRSVGR